jgi:hypothetical protein
MYGVPTDLDVSAFYGGRHDQLCLGPFDLQFHFSNGKSISVGDRGDLSTQPER